MGRIEDGARWLKDAGVASLVDRMVGALLAARPEDVPTFAAQYLLDEAKRAKGTNGSGAPERSTSPPPAVRHVDSSGGGPRAIRTAPEYAGYYAQHGVIESVEQALAAVGKAGPKNPMEFLSDHFDKKCAEVEPESVKVASKDARLWRKNTMASLGGWFKPKPVYKVLAVDINPAAVPVLQRCGKVDARPKMTEADLVACIGEYDALVCRSSVTVTERIIEAGRPRLRMIALSQVGMDNVPIPLCAERGVRICNSPQGNTTTTAEHTIALIFAMVRKLTAADQSIRNGRWERTPFLGTQLSGNALGLLGLGNIAFMVAKAAHAMGMSIVAYDPYADQAKADSIGAKIYRRREDLPELLAQVKVLSIHVPLTKETRGIISAAELATMQAGSYVVNCARGGIVDEQALSDALASGHLAGAATDVFAREQEFVDAKSVPGDFCLVTAPHCVLSPHLGAMTKEAQEAVAIDAALQVEEYLNRGGEPKFAITKPDPADPARLVDARPPWMKS